MSQAQDDKAPSTALASEAVNQAQADPEPSTANVTPSLTEKKHDSAGNAAQGDPGPSTGQAESGSVTGQGDSAAISGISTTEDKPLRKKSTDQVSIAKESSPKAADPKATDAATPQSPSDPPQIGEGAGGSGGSQESQPQKVDAEESQNLEANISMGEQPTVSTPTLRPGDKLKQSRRRKQRLNRGGLSLVGLVNSQALNHLGVMKAGNFLPHRPDLP